MYGIIDTRYKTGDNKGILRGKAYTVSHSLEKRKKILTHLREYEKHDIENTELQITKLIGCIKIGDTVEYNQTNGLVIVVT